MSFDALKYLADVIWPRTCELCGQTLVRGERMICLGCLEALPRTHIHTDGFNTIHQRLAGYANIEKAGAMMHYYPGSAESTLIKKGKYNGMPGLLARLAREYAAELQGDGFFDGIDVMTPVGMYWLKRLSRGYNQSRVIARALSESTGIKVVDNLVCVKSHSTQTRKTLSQRRHNASGIYRVNHPERLQGKHVLVVDDILTTGATIGSCCQELAAEVPGVRISVLTLGLTHMR